MRISMALGACTIKKRLLCRIGVDICSGYLPLSGRGRR
jgi:hypothetical protein